jgi:PTS system ascorbate-specific IIB component
LKQIKPKFKVITVCGVGMGSSLILKMTAEDAFREAKIEATVEHSDLSSAKSMNSDIIIVQSLHAAEVTGLAPIIVVIKNFLDKEFIKQETSRLLKEKGWITD